MLYLTLEMKDSGSQPPYRPSAAVTVKSCYTPCSMDWAGLQGPASAFQFTSTSRRVHQTFLRVRRVAVQSCATSVDAKMFQVDARGQSPILAAWAKRCPTKFLPRADPAIHWADLNLELFVLTYSCLCRADVWPVRYKLEVEGV
jgi:hypothetical protein